MSKKIIVVGGVAGGATAIARMRRLNEDAEIILLERGEFISFANCGLPYYIGGTIANRDSLFVAGIDMVKARYNIDIRNFSEVVKINKEEKTVTVKNVKDGSKYKESYDDLVLSTGSTPFVPPMEGVDNENVFTLWNIPDTDRIYKYIEDKNPKKAVIAGGGFIGLEVAENLVDRGIEVVLVEFADQVMAPFDKDMAKLIENHLVDKGVDLNLGLGVSKFINNGKTVILSDGREVETDMSLLSIGVRANTGLAKDAGLELNQRGGVVVDEFMKTSDPNIYAVGDMIEVVNKVNGLKTMIPLAGPANKQGRAVGANILGMKPETYDGSIGTSVAKIFDLTVASTGENEKSLKGRGLEIHKDYDYVLIHPQSHAGYYPGATPMTLKMIFSLEDQRVLGAQIVGYDGVDKRIDTIATTIHFKGTVYDLTKLELAYAPPYSSAKDPVNMAGYVATDMCEGLTESISYEEYLANKDKYISIDVREEVECSAGKMEESINIPLSVLRTKLGELDKEKTYAVNCMIGLRGYVAERVLKENGYKVVNLKGGYMTYLSLTKKLEKGKIKPKKEEKQALDIKELDVCGLSCPGPIVSVSKKMEELKDGERLRVNSTDPGFINDIDNWCENTGNTLIARSDSKGIFSAIIEKGRLRQGTVEPAEKEKTIIVFDGDMDKAIAAFIIATGSAAMGNKVNMFFTFWGLNVIRKPNKIRVKKDFIGRMFGAMLPRGASKLGLSKMNFGGAGSKMMKGVMKKKGIASLEELIQDAIDAGIKMTACQMSMDVMGITKEELLDGVEVGGVATMLNDNDRSNMNLFI